MSVERNVARYFFAATEGFRDRPAISFKKHTWTYKTLHMLVLTAAHNMRKRGIGPGSVVAVMTRDPLASTISFLATSLLGASWTGAKPILHKTKEVAVTHWVATEKGTLPAELGPISMNELCANPTPRSIDEFPFEGEQDYDFFYAATSGSTGTPKYLAMPQHIIVARNRAYARAVGVSEGTKATICMAPLSSPFFNRVFGVLSSGGWLIFNYQPSIWPRFDLDYVEATPSQIRDLLQSEKPATKLKRIIMGGGKSPDTFIHLLADHFHAITDFYGATETGASVQTEIRRNDLGEITRESRIIDAEVEIIDADGRVVPEGEKGTLRVRGKDMLHGYLNAPEAQAQAFRDGWFHPGDLAMWVDGHLSILGREKDEVDIGGVKLSAQAYDEALATVEGLEDAVFFSYKLPDGLDAVAVMAKMAPGQPRQQVSEQIKRTVLKALGISAVPRKILFTESVPRTENGKPDRPGCVALMEKLEADEDTEPAGGFVMAGSVAIP